MEKIVVTSGQLYSDIDVLACSIAYCELLVKEGKESFAILPGVLNKSVTNTIKAWRLNYSKSPPGGKMQFVIVDMSNPKYFASFVNENKVIEIFDHHSGFVGYWKEKIGNRSHIEKIGACATLIWEEYKKRNFNKQISETSANLLYTAIVSNTLNFKAAITTTRDKNAFRQLANFTKLPKSWIEKYFEEQDMLVYRNPYEAIINDLRQDELNVAQIEMWNSKDFIETRKSEIFSIMEKLENQNWFLTSPSLSEGKNYLLTKNNKIKKLLEKVISAKFDGDLGVTNKLWLRKEIFQKIQNLKN